MARPWDISADDIAQWAQRGGAEYVLPELVARLLWATAPVIRLGMRAGAGVRFAGWDGLVTADQGSAFCPPGASAWELSVDKKVKAKLDDDFAKRTASPARPVDPARTTYVAVTAHHFAGKEAWIHEKSERGAWAGVRGYDADDLAMWLGQAPAVAGWFAAQLGRSASGVRDLETFLDTWRSRTHPPLPPDLLVAGGVREKATRDVRAWIERPVSRNFLHIWADSRDEAVAFVATLVTRAPQSERERWLARALVVDSREAWSWAVAQRPAEPMILVPMFDGADPERVRGRAHVVIPHAGRPADTGAGVMLDAVPIERVEEILRHLGFDDAEARRLARETGGKLLALQRECGYWESPSWAQGETRVPLLAMLLAGAWAPKNPADREAMRGLGVDPDEVETVCAELSSSADAAFTRETEHWRHSVYRWRAPKDAWKALAPGLTDTLIERFAKVAVQVLGERDPRYDLAKEERFYAAVHGKVRAYSKELRAGLADSLARLPLSDDMLRATLGPGRGSGLAQRIVHELLAPDWQIWASLADVLPVLAEAAPKRFLDALDASLNQGDEGASHLFAEESESGGSPHPGLLWALEALGWNEQLMPRVALALARLAARDPGGRLANRPQASLEALLDHRVPQTRASVTQRIAVLDRIIEHEPEFGWTLVLGLIQRNRASTIWPSKQTRYHDWSLSLDQRDIEPDEIHAGREALVARAVRCAGENAGRWAMLVEAADALPWSLQLLVLDALDERKANISDADHVLWPALRGQLCFLLEVVESTGDAAAPVMTRLGELYEFFTPSDFVARTAWLFAPGAAMPVRGSHFEEQYQEVVAARQRALDELWQLDDHWSLIAALAGAVEIPLWMGSALADMPFAAEVEQAVVRQRPAYEFGAVIHGFIARRAHQQGMGWLEEIVKSLQAQGRMDDAAGGMVVMSPSSELWDLVDALGEPLRSAYWTQIEWITRVTPEERDRAVTNLIDAGRPRMALFTASLSSGDVSPHTALRVLEARRRAQIDDQLDTLPSDRLRNEGYVIEQMFERVDQDPSIDVQQVMGLEIFFLGALTSRRVHKDSRSARRLYEAMAGSPELFVELVTMLYRSEADDTSEQTRSDREHSNRAQLASRALFEWDGYPGEELGGEEREQALLSWTEEALDKLKQVGRAGPGAMAVARVLARVPHGSDNAWPCRAARVLVERGEIEDFAEELGVAKRNLRGMTTRGIAEGGAQERVLAATFRSSAETLRAEWPRTAAMLDDLGAYYEREADAQDEDARTTRARHGMDVPEEDRDSSLPATRATPAGEISAIDWIELRELELSPSLRVDLAPRLNLLTGNNGLGKTLVLDSMFWALTGLWPGARAWPARDQERRARAAICVGQGRDTEAVSRFDPLAEQWSRPENWPRPGAVVLYARLDGWFSIWDPVRNRRAGNGSGERASGFLFSPAQVWEGMRGPDGVLCNGLLDDLLDWQFRQRALFASVREVLARLSPDDVPLRLGEPVRLSVHDARDIPTLEMPYGAIPVVHASAAIKRILGLAYLLVWAWHEHNQAARLAGEPGAQRLVLIIDEVEAHLHPRWQRMFLPALFEVVRDLGSKNLESKIDVQVLASTHAPLVTASVETFFEPDSDRLFHFAIEGARAVVETLLWAKQGDAVNWLVSETFGLRQARSREAERVIEAAEAFMRGDVTPPGLASKEAIHRELLRVLPGHDDFWPRWLVETGAVQ